MSEGPASESSVTGRERTTSNGLTLRSSLLRLSLLVPTRVGVSRVLPLTLSQCTHRLLEVVLPERALLIDNEMDSISAGGEEVVLQRRRSVVGVDDVARLRVSVGDPLGELHGVGDRCGEEDVVDLVGEEDDGFFPDNSTL